MNSDDVLVHIHYSENCLCKYAQEIQILHLGGSHRQFTLHRRSNSEELEVISLYPFFERLQHDAPAIGAYIKKVLLT